SLSCDPLASVFPSGEKTTAPTSFEWPRSASSSFPVAASQTRTSASPEPAATRAPSGENATECSVPLSRETGGLRVSRSVGGGATSAMPLDDGADRSTTPSPSASPSSAAAGRSGRIGGSSSSAVSSSSQMLDDSRSCTAGTALSVGDDGGPVGGSG